MYMESNQENNFLNFEMESQTPSIIKVIGVGGGGSNAVNYMYNLGIKDVDFIICNTDIQALAKSAVPIKIQLGQTLTEGLGAGNEPEKGEQAAIESLDQITQILSTHTKMVFITAGMGGGTGTGAAPIIAKTAKEMGILTVAIVTLPFQSEGMKRYNHAIEGIRQIKDYVDSLLIINNQKLREMHGDLPFSEAFAKADDVLATAAKGIAEIITLPGHINVDFADVKNVMKNSGVAIMGSGVAEGQDRAISAIKQALDSPLLNNSDIRGAKNILLNITCGEPEVTLDEISQITEYLQEVAGNNSDIIFGVGKNLNMNEKISTTIIATGFGTDTFNIDDSTNPKKVHSNKNNVSQEKSSKKVYSLDDEQQELSFEIEEKVMDNNNTSIDENNQTTMDLSNNDTVENLEKVPAFQRKKSNIVQNTSTQSPSNITITNNKNYILKNDNPYLHENID